MSALGDIVRAQIRQNGPISVADYMALCLSHPEHGYYTTHDPFGAAGDFTTAPEISQMFGELIGLWLAQVWVDQGQPAPFVLAELGPGRGTLMADILRVTKQVPGFREAACLYLVETSAALRDVQSSMLKDTAPTWVGSIGELPEGPLFVVANEFFDALPVRQFRRDGSGWSEQMVGLERDKLILGGAAAMSMPVLDARHPSASDGDVVEMSPLSEAIASELGARISSAGGAALIIDYGDWHGKGDTFQALRNHEPADPLAAPGSADLTAHVNFLALAQALHPSRVTPMKTQGEFLEQLGITARAKALARSGAEQAITSQHRRLTHPQEMGTLFKVIAATADNAPTLPGFA